MSQNKYVLITAARNEEDFIEATLKSVTAQTILPQRWIIVSDGSTDGTDEIVTRYEKRYDFIKLIQLPARRQRNFAAKVQAVRIGYESLQEMEFDFIGNLDADASFEPDYYERVLAKFNRDEKLGVAGGTTYDKIDDKFVEVASTAHRVCGMIQMFRRVCYEQMGGYLELPYGGEDSAAAIMALMKGWEVKTFNDIHAFHHRRRGMSKNGVWQARVREGIRNYQLGWCSIYMLAKTLSRLHEKPYVLGSLVRLSAYLQAWLVREKRLVPDEFVSFVRQEQIRKIKSMLRLVK
ncbi:glycosyltransferase [Planctomycetota bacterium]